MMRMNCYVSGSLVGAWPDFEPREVELPGGSVTTVRGHPHMWTLVDRLRNTAYSEERLVVLALMMQLQSGRAFEPCFAAAVGMAIRHLDSERFDV